MNENNLRYIPNNVVGNKRLFGLFRLRNFIEGVLLGVGLGWIVMQINFVNSVKIFFLIVGFGGGFIIGNIGIRNKSITEAIISAILFRIQKCKYHKRSIQYVKEGTTFTGQAGENLSYAEVAYYTAKQKLQKRKTKPSSKNVKKAKRYVEAVRGLFGI